MKKLFNVLVILHWLAHGYLLAAAAADDADPDVKLDHHQQGRDHHHRSKRIVFTFNSCAGVLVALSVPLIIPNRNIFFSYNFEMNYNEPTDVTDYTQGVLKRIETPEINSGRDMGGGNGTGNVEEAVGPVVRRSASFTRKKVYRSIEVQLNRMELNGKRCLLRAICEAADIPVFEHNGILGDLIHILLTPSHSRDENLPPEFYRAEKMGHKHDCGRYRKHCPKSILDVISVLM